LDRKIDSVDKKLDIHIVKTYEGFNSIDQRFSSLDAQIAEFKESTDTQITELKKSTEAQLTDIRLQLRAQGSRLWTFFGGLFAAGFGIIAKLTFFSGGN
jgi:hypothetical protein